MDMVDGGRGECGDIIYANKLTAILLIFQEPAFIISLCFGFTL